MATPYIGSKISLISKSEIRYEGTLFGVDQNDSTVSLSNVRSFGTEGRKGGGVGEIAPVHEIFDIIVFRGSDIKDLNVSEPAPVVVQNRVPTNDPAIVNSYSQGFGGAGFPQQAPQQVTSLQFPSQQQSSTWQPPPSTTFPTPSFPSPSRPLQQTTQVPAVTAQLTSTGQQSTNAAQSQPVATTRPQQPLPAPSQQTNVIPPLPASATWGSKTPNAAPQNEQQQNQQNQSGYGNRRNTTGQQQHYGQQRQFNNNRNYNQQRYDNPQRYDNNQQGQQQQRYDHSQRYDQRGGFDSSHQQQRGFDSSRGQQQQYGRGGGRGRGGFHYQVAGGNNQNSNPPAKFSGDFDFEISNQKFEKDKVLAEVAQNQPEQTPIAHYTKASFFDTISCEATEKKEKPSRQDVMNQRKVDYETFGTNNNVHRYRGRGGNQNMRRNQNNNRGGGDNSGRAARNQGSDLPRTTNTS